MEDQEMNVYSDPHPKDKGILMGFGKDWKIEIGEDYYYCPYNEGEKKMVEEISDKDCNQKVVVVLSEEQMNILAQKIAEKTLSLIREEEDKKDRALVKAAMRL